MMYDLFILNDVSNLKGNEIIKLYDIIQIVINVLDKLYWSKLVFLSLYEILRPFRVFSSVSK